jgi:hypothetical protein
LSGEPAKKLPDRNDSDSIPSRHFDQVEVTFKIIVSGNQVLCFATDCSFQDLVVIGIAAYFQFVRCLYDRRPSRDQSNKCLCVPVGIPKPSYQSWSAENFCDFAELRGRRDDTELVIPPGGDDLSWRSVRLEEGGNPDVGVK